METRADNSRFPGSGRGRVTPPPLRARSRVPGSGRGRSAIGTLSLGESDEVRFRTVDTEGERSRTVKGPSSGARLCAVLGEKVRPGDRHSCGDGIELVPESPSASASCSESENHTSSMSSGRLQRGSHVLPSDPHPSADVCNKYIL